MSDLELAGYLFRAHGPEEVWTAAYRYGRHDAAIALNITPGNPSYLVATGNTSAVTADTIGHGLLSLRHANAVVAGWEWCSQHGRPRYDGLDNCTRLHPGYDCARHDVRHSGDDLGELCRAWDEANASGPWWRRLFRRQ